MWPAAIFVSVRFESSTLRASPRLAAVPVASLAVRFVKSGTCTSLARSARRIDAAAKRM